MSYSKILLLHDVTLDSGFQGSNAAKYKISKSKFLKILAILKSDVILSFDDGGDSINSAFLRQLRNARKIYVFIPTRYIGKPGFLTQAQIVALGQEGIEIGSHSHSHSNFLTGITDNEFRLDWLKSKEILENMLNKKVDCCSIPYGYFNSRHITILKEIGFETIMTSEPPFTRSNELTQPRIALDDRFMNWEFICLRIFGLNYLIFRSLFNKFILKKLKNSCLL